MPHETVSILNRTSNTRDPFMSARNQEGPQPAELKRKHILLDCSTSTNVTTSSHTPRSVVALTIRKLSNLVLSYRAYHLVLFS